MWQGAAALMAALAGLGLTWLFQSSLLLIAGLAAGRLLRRSGPAVQSAVYRTTLAAVLICPGASASLTAMGVQGVAIRLPEPTPEAPLLEAPLSMEPPIAMDPMVAPSPLEVDARPRAAPPPVESRPAEPVAAAPKAPTPAWRLRSTLTLARAALLAWALGASFLALRLWVGQARMRDLRRSATPAEPEVETLCRGLAARLEVKPPSVWRSPFLFSPCLDGVRRPAILLPDDAVEDLADTFVHELAHLARRDALWNLLRRSASALLWMQPLLWALSRRLESTAEEVCDDHVVHFGADRARYAGHLLGLASRALPPPAPSAVGMVSLRTLLARRIVRILDTSRTLSTRAGGRAVLAMLAVGLLGTLGAGLLGVGGSRRAEAQAPATPEKKEGSRRVMVVGPDGKPFQGATVIALDQSPLVNGNVGRTGKSDEYRDVEFARGLTDPDGVFDLPLGPDDPKSRYIQKVAMAPGFGLGFQLGMDQPIRLRPGDIPITGRVVDLEGRPLAGVDVRLGELEFPDPELAPEVIEREDPGRSHRRIPLEGKHLKPNGIVTDADGRFRIEGLGKEVIVNLKLSGPTIALKKVRIRTRDMKTFAAAVPASNLSKFNDPAVYGANCTIPVSPTRPIEGIVRDVETNEPIPHVIVAAAFHSGANPPADGDLAAETDAQGRYRIVGLPKEDDKGHQLSVYPPRDRPYFITRDITVPSSPGIGPVAFDIGLKKGIWITGRVTDLKTSRPVKAAIDYFPFLDNESAKNYSNFDPNVTSWTVGRDRYKTDAEGRFRIPGLPGRGVVTASTEDKMYRVGVGAESIPDRDKSQPFKAFGLEQLPTYDRIFLSYYQGLKAIDVPGGAESSACNLVVDPGGSVTLRLVDEARQAVTQTLFYGHYPRMIQPEFVQLHDESTVRVGGMEPGKPRHVEIRHAGRKIGAIFSVPPVDFHESREITVTLRAMATVKGRIVDATGGPARCTISIERGMDVKSLFASQPWESESTNSSGEFRCNLLPASDGYTLTTSMQVTTSPDTPKALAPFKSFSLAKGLTLEPGQVVDLGTFDVTTGKKVAEPEAPAAKADGLSSIRGRILDLEGRPVAGVMVQISEVESTKTGKLDGWLEAVRKGEPPWISYKRIVRPRLEDPVKDRPGTKTDADGRFRLDGIPAERIVSLTLQGDTIAYDIINVVTRAMEPILARGDDNWYGPGQKTIYGDEFTYTARPGRHIEGVLKDAKTGEPLAGAEIRSYRFAGSRISNILGKLETKSDERGRFRLIGMPKGEGNQLLVVPNDDGPYFLREVKVPNPPGVGPTRIEVDLHRGIWIEGRLTEKATGRPVVGARLHYLPFRDNAFVRAIPEFTRGGRVDGSGHQNRYLTKADGSFRLVGMPGRAIVGAAVDSRSFREGAGSEAIQGMNEHGMFDTYSNPVIPGKLWPTVMAEMNPRAGVESVHLDLEAVAGPSVRIKALMPDGQPISGLKTRGLEGRGSLERVEMKAEAEVKNLMPGEERQILVKHEARKLGKVIRVRQGDDAKGPVSITLEPLASITGRILDIEGNPVALATITTNLIPSENFTASLEPVLTGPDGRFIVPEVPVGCRYSLWAESPEVAKHTAIVGLGREIEVKPGAVIDIGDLRFKD
ncbi:M56 family metallopeptidase [Singulisphaera sp. PoT]|uniref:M56 family metallopeptidase n=1 Tax=Singulisphaera sp. PoT TaxID=3411797 RepID=UPI003BF52378